MLLVFVPEGGCRNISGDGGHDTTLGQVRHGWNVYVTTFVGKHVTTFVATTGGQSFLFFAFVVSVILIIVAFVVFVIRPSLSLSFSWPFRGPFRRIYLSNIRACKPQSNKPLLT